MEKRFAPAAERNRQPLLEVLSQVLPNTGVVLEVASGTGQHAAYFAEFLPMLRWQPSDPSPDALRSIRAWVSDASRENLAMPLSLDVQKKPWPVEHADAVLCINMIHIAPWEAAVALFEGSSTLLETGKPLVTYGPYRVHGRHTAPSNEAFDQSLRSRDPSWGVRDLDELAELATRTGFRLDKRFEMPANNMTLVWARVA
jgi:SAM-dependent methyltransferase